MTLVLDAGAFVAVERGDREIVALIKRERLADRAPLSHGGVVGQVWRGGAGRHAELARLLPGVDVKAIDEDLGKRAGVLLRESRRADVIDSALIALAADGDELLTSGADDLRALAEAAGLHIDIIAV